MNERLHAMGFAPFSPDAFNRGEGLDDVDTVVSLTQGSCTDRAATIFCQAHAEMGRVLRIRHVGSFEESVHAIRRDARAVMLVPQLHAIRKTLEQKSHFPDIHSQGFQLPNPQLHVATPIESTSDRTYLWSLPTLVPLVREQYGDALPFEEIVPADSTQDAAEQCARIFGGAYCVTNEEGLRKFRLQSVQALRHIVMQWFLYRKKRKGTADVTG